MIFKDNQHYTTEEIEKCISMLGHLVDDVEQYVSLSDEQKIALMKVAGQLSTPDREQLKKRKKAKRKLNRKRIVRSDKKARAATGIRLAREDAVFSAPLQLEDHTDSAQQDRVLHSPGNCYVCKSDFIQIALFFMIQCALRVRS